MESQTSQPADAGTVVADTSALDTNQAAAVMASLLGGEEAPEKKPAEPAEGEEGREPPKPAEEGADPEDPPKDEKKFTVEVDGKSVEISESELINGYKAQKASTQKFEAAAALRKEAEAATEKARAERQQYAQGLQQNHMLLTAALAEQDKIDWDALREADPQEFLKQQHLQQKRQAALHQINQQGRQIVALEHQERLTAHATKVQTEQQALLAKLPEWKDQAKRSAEEKLIADELISRGFEPERVFGKPHADGSPNLEAPGITDHRILLLARDAMRYQQMMAKAKEAAKKVEQLPQRTVKPDTGSVSIDKRGQQFQQLKKSGSPRDAVGLMTQFI